ncbi:hypothetical protein COU53_00365 [Candidatus Pacearchaeota archaeon CG10_big_fil_rev_8_21_14_0_10_30_48]|nr:MAG: hypothetical protein COU53_00365 [Candidatus Pacearchaeota archaeon CG10_big_fil_rev_8_21_14_0_10_30_48]
MNIVTDTNILISALIKNGITRDFIVKSKNNFIIPEFEVYEIYEHKNEIIKKSKLSEREFDTIFLRLLRNIKIIPTDLIIDKKEEAERIIGHIDKDDVQFIATALTFNCSIWSDDKHFKKQNKVRILTTKKIINLNQK